MAPPVTRTATFAISVLTILAGVVVWVLGVLPEMAISGGVIPGRFSDTGILQNYSFGVPAILTPLTATLLHADFFHLLVNLLLLFWCGLAVERVLGRGPLILLYVAGAYAAAIAQVLWQTEDLTPMIGASGAVSALLGAYALGFGRPREISSSPAVNRTLNAIWLLVAWVAIQWGIGFATANSAMQIATAAHVGGFVAGLLAWRPLMIWRYRRA